MQNPYLPPEAMLTDAVPSRTSRWGKILATVFLVLGALFSLLAIQGLTDTLYHYGISSRGLRSPAFLSMMGVGLGGGLWVGGGILIGQRKTRPGTIRVLLGFPTWYVGMSFIQAPTSSSD